MFQKSLNNERLFLTIEKQIPIIKIKRNEINIRKGKGN